MGKKTSTYYLYIYICVCVCVCVCVYIWRALFQNAINAKKKKKMSSSCHFAVYWTYSLLHQCFMPNRYISLFKMYLTLLTSQRGALATDARSCSLWRSLLERPPSRTGNPGSRPTRCDGADPGGFNNHCLTMFRPEPTDHFNMINWILTKCMGLGKKIKFSWKLLKWIYSVFGKELFIHIYMCVCVCMYILYICVCVCMYISIY